MNRSCVIVIWSIYQWETIFRRPMVRALARSLEGKGSILYVNNPFSPCLTFLMNRKRYERDSGRPVLEKVESNLAVYRPRMFLNQYLIEKLGSQDVCYGRLGRKVLKALETLGWSGGRRLSWVNYPEQLSLIGRIAEDGVIYECYDEYLKTGSAEQNKRTKELEDELLRKANVVFTTSESLFENRKLRHPRAYFTPNGVDFELFNRLTKLRLPDDMKRIPRPIVGYVGNLRDWLDLPLIERTASQLKKFSFVLIGPCYDSEYKGELKSFLGRISRNEFPNIYWLGEKPHEEVPAYMGNFDVAVVPFKTGEFFDNVNPLKLWEYMASGKPVVSTYLKGLEPFAETIFLSKTPEEFTAYIEGAAKQGSNGAFFERQKREIALARERSWDGVTKAMAEILL